MRALATRAASRWWLHHALADLSRQLHGRLLIGAAPAWRRCRNWRIGTGHGRLLEPSLRTGIGRRDSAIKQTLRAAGVKAWSGNAALWFEPWEVSTRQGGAFRVFTPFWKRLLEMGLPSPGAAIASGAGRGDDWPARLSGVVLGVGGMSPAELGLLPDIGWDSGIAAHWQPTGPPPRRGSMNSSLSMCGITAGPRPAGPRTRVAPVPLPPLRPARPREVVAACHTGRYPAAEFLRELGWREFAHHLLFHFPLTTGAPDGCAVRGVRLAR